MSSGSQDETRPDGWEPIDEEPQGGKARFMVSLGKPQLAELREYAEREGISVAELVRRAVDEYLDIRRDGSP